MESKALGTRIHFPNGIFGFEEIKDFLLRPEDSKNVIWSLQAAESDYPTLIVVDPLLIVPDYSPELTAADQKILGSPKKEDLCCLVVAVIRKKLEDSVVNLKSPVLINVKNRTGVQTILEKSDYPVRSPLLRSRKNGGV